MVHPPFCEHILMPWLSSSSGFPLVLVIILFNAMRVQSHLSTGSKGPSSCGMEVLCVREEDASSSILLTQRGTYPLHPPFGLAKLWPSSMSTYVGHGVHHLMVSMGKDIIPSAKCMCSFQNLCLLHITWCLHPSSVDVLVDFHGRSLKLLINPPKGSLAGWALGDHLTTALLWHHHIFTSLGSGLAWDGAGTSVPCMMDTYTQGNTNLWCNKKSVLVEDAWPSALVHHFIGGDICCNPTYHLVCLLFPPIPNLPLSLKGISLH